MWTLKEKIGIAALVVVGIAVAGLIIFEVYLRVTYWGTPFNELPGWVQWWLFF